MRRSILYEFSVLEIRHLELTVRCVPGQLDYGDVDFSLSFKVTAHHLLRYKTLDTTDCKSLAGPRLTVGKERANAAAPCPRHERLHNVIVDLLCR